VNKLDHHVIAS